MNPETEPGHSVNPEAKIFVLVHGGAHGAWAYERLAAHLLQEGHHVVAQDLPGHGLKARFPRSYTTRPLNPQEFATEPSPIAHLTLRDYCDHVTATVRRLGEVMPDRQIVLVGHSMAGLVLNRVGETLPDLIGRLVYVSAWMIADGTSFSDYMAAPELSTGLIPSVLLADPSVVGALRMDFRSADPAYRASVKAAFAADADDGDWDAVTHLLTPDTPAGPLAEPVTITPARWGRIPRTYISCTDDRALPLAAQRRFIGEADEHTPENPTDVRELPTGHSPFVSQPARLAEILLKL
ncbi:alpha/beta fold hydrolase [Actinomadura nitritigenes]|uniref:Alpha/beta fold hydrolase n=1 Tax=Actinomadura nitritigenes TaxID=134602 RepID=A0ABS3R2G5_9ACTN|nr:alpha/beta fold hydrolase [Actinomadura nitritigenes]MBO2440449.1 alpha/beta fold hydrolase [Actinomadura nitritigenes]